MIIDIFCGESLDCIQAPEFKAPIIQAMDESIPYIMFMKHFPIFRLMMESCPPYLSKVLSPGANGLVDFRKVIYASSEPRSDR